jgi:iron-sulfur cluster assembly protein
MKVESVKLDNTVAITITEAARNKLAEYMRQDPSRFLRVAVVAGGCSGNTYSATVENELADNDDVVYEKDKIRIVSDPRSSLFIEGLNVDYSNDLIQAGFRLTNTNASESCGCGASFSV